MAKKIDLKSLDWASVLIDAAMQTRRSYEESRGAADLGPQLREIVRAYQAENGDGDDLDEDEDEDEDFDEVRNDQDCTADQPPEGRRAAKEREDDAESIRLRQQLAVLHERLAATEARLEAQRALLESTRRESSTREHELMGLLGEALRASAPAQAPAPEMARPTPPSTDHRDSSAPTPEPPSQGAVDVERDPEFSSTDVDSDIGVDDDALCDTDREIELDPDLGTEADRSTSEILEVEVTSDGFDHGAALDRSHAEPQPGSAAPHPPETPGRALALPPTEKAVPMPHLAHVVDSGLLPTDPLGQADAALQRGDFAGARRLFEALEAESRELGPQADLALITIRRGLAEACLGLRDLDRSRWISKQAWSAASSMLATAPTTDTLFNYLSSARVRGMVLLMTGETSRAQRHLRRACAQAALCGVDRTKAHQNELDVMVRLLQGIESSKALTPGRKPKRRRNGKGRR